MRANRIPARCLAGRFADSESAIPARIGGAPGQMHVRAEFFAKGVGWVPVDPSGGVQHDKRTHSLTWFGHDAGDLIVFHIDPGFVIKLRGDLVRESEWLQAPAWMACGSGAFTDGVILTNWVVTPTPLAPRMR